MDTTVASGAEKGGGVAGRTMKRLQPCGFSIETGIAVAVDVAVIVVEN